MSVEFQVELAVADFDGKGFDVEAGDIERLAGDEIGAPAVEGASENVVFDFTAVETGALVGAAILDGVKSVADATDGNGNAVDLESEGFGGGDVTNGTNFDEVSHDRNLTVS